MRERKIKLEVFLCMKNRKKLARQRGINENVKRKRLRGFSTFLIDRLKPDESSRSSADLLFFFLLSFFILFCNQSVRISSALAEDLDE